MGDERVTERSMSSAMVDGAHRYRLSRWWGDGPRVLWCMLNPSTADERDDDPTIRKCVGFARRWRFDGIEVVNLYSWRATHPRDLAKNLEHAVDHQTDITILEMARRCPIVIVGWGSYAARPWALGRATRVLQDLVCCCEQLECLGTNRDGSPRHPLMVAYATPREPYE
jgi:hypothetical protein